MRTFEFVPEPVKKCVRLVCDLCGKEAETTPSGDPDFFDKNGDRCRGQVWSAVYGLDESELDELDLCGDCAKWLIGQIREKKIRRGES